MTVQRLSVSLGELEEVARIFGLRLAPFEEPRALWARVLDASRRIQEALGDPVDLVGDVLGAPPLERRWPPGCCQRCGSGLARIGEDEPFCLLCPDPSGQTQPSGEATTADPYILRAPRAFRPTP